jgi:hypothetical protein
VCRVVSARPTESTSAMLLWLLGHWVRASITEHNEAGRGGAAASMFSRRRRAQRCGKRDDTRVFPYTLEQLAAPGAPSGSSARKAEAVIGWLPNLSQTPISNLNFHGVHLQSPEHQLKSEPHGGGVYTRYLFVCVCVCVCAAAELAGDCSDRMRAADGFRPSVCFRAATKQYLFPQTKHEALYSVGSP